MSVITATTEENLLKIKAITMNTMTTTVATLMIKAPETPIFSAGPDN